MRAKKRLTKGISQSISLSINQRTTNRQQRIYSLLMTNNRKEWLKTDAGKQYKARTNKNYRQKKQQTKKDNLKVNKSFNYYFNDSNS
jgi:hypothetical protein